MDLEGQAETPPMPAGQKGRQGFASMDEVKQKEIASKGGKAAHQKGTAHEYNVAEARINGKRGGLASGLARKRKARIAAMQAEAAEAARQ